MTARAVDVVVIGAGVGGLGCAALLARRGLRVLVAEQAPGVGGCCSAFRAEGYTFDAAVHHVSGGHPRSLVGQALAAARAPVDLVRLDPMDALWWPDLRVDVPGTWEAWVEVLVRRFPAEAAGIEAAFAELLRLYRAALGSPGGRAVLERWGDASFADLVGRFVGDERLVRVLSGQWGYLGTPPQRLAAVGMAQMLVNYWRDGAYYPRGGTAALPDALAASVVRAGGAVAVGRGVRRILVAGGRAAGVELADGRVVAARWVVSNADVPQTVGRLLGDAAPAAYRDHVAGLEPSPPFLLLYLGVAATGPSAPIARGFYHLESRLGGPWLYVSSASEVDPSLAPPGRHALTVVVSLDPPAVAAGDWSVVRQRAVRQVIGLLDDLAPGLAQRVEVVRAAHPPAAARASANFCGVPYGWAVTPEQAGPRRLDPATPVDGLHLAGQWTRPGPGVCAAIASGWSTANVILRQAAAPRPSRPPVAMPL